MALGGRCVRYMRILRSERVAKLQNKYSGLETVVYIRGRLPSRCRAHTEVTVHSKDCYIPAAH